MPEQLVKAPESSIPRPEMPSEPPQNVKDIKFEFNPELLTTGGESTIKIDKQEVKTSDAEIKKEAEPIIKPPVEKEEVKKEEVKIEKKEEQKKTGAESVLKPPTEVAKKESEQKKEGVSQAKEQPTKKELITPVKPEGHDSFDYSGYTPQEQITLKNMSRQSRDYVTNLIKENKSLAALKDSTYLQHENGYTLSPEFNEIRQRAYLASTESQCWERALLSIKAGKKFQDVVGFDKNGNPQMGPEKDPTDADEIRIANNLTMCIQAAQQFNGQLQVFPQRFKQQVQADLQAVDQAQREQFAWVADPKLLDYSVSVDGQDKKLSQIKADFKSILPVYWQSSPIADVASNLMVALVIRTNELNEAKNGRQVAEIKQKEIARGEPSSDNASTEVGQIKINGKLIPSVFNLDGMPGRS